MLDNFLPFLTNVKQQANGILCSCPWPEHHKNRDRHPSFSINEEGVGYCFVEGKGYSPHEIAQRLGIADRNYSSSYSNQNIEAVYQYKDAEENLLYERVRFKQKKFLFRTYDENGKERWGLKGRQQTLYRLPELIKSTGAVYITEGEKDVLTLVDFGFTATTSGGVKTWKPCFAEFFKDRDVVIVPDQDGEGQKFCETIRQSLVHHAKSIRIINMPEGKDVSEWVAVGGTAEKFQEMLANTPLWQPVNKNGPGACEIESAPPLKHNLISLAFPTKGWLREYIDFISPTTDAPDINHLIAGLVAISTVVARNVYFLSGDDTIYPNLFVCLIGPSSTARKSTTINPAKRIIRSIKQDLVLADSSTPEACLDELAASSCGLLVKHEFGGFLSTCAKIRYQAEWKPLLTELYDCPSVYKRKIRSQEIVIRNPFLSLFGATTIDWLKSTPEDFGAGFLARFLFVPPDDPKEPIPRPPKTDLRIRERLTQDLNSMIPAEPREMLFSEEADKCYDEWFWENHEDKKEFAHSNPLLVPWCERLNTYFIKLSILFEISMNPSATAISGEATVHAYWLLCHLKKSMKNLVTQNISFSRVEKLEKLIIAAVTRRPGSRWSDISNFAHLSRFGFAAKEGKAALDDLIEKEVIIESSDGKHYMA